MPLPTVNPMISRSPFPATSSTMSRLHHPTMDALEFHRSAFSTNPIFPGSSTGTTGGGGTPGGDATSFAFAAFSWYSSMERLMSSTMPALGERRAERARRAEARAGAATRRDDRRAWRGGGGWGREGGWSGGRERVGRRAVGRSAGRSGARRAILRAAGAAPTRARVPRLEGGGTGERRERWRRARLSTFFAVAEEARREGRRVARGCGAGAARGTEGRRTRGARRARWGGRRRRRRRCRPSWSTRGAVRCARWRAGTARGVAPRGGGRDVASCAIAIREIFERLDSHTNTFFYFRKG